MIVAGVSMFHNEADVAAAVVRHMLEECDVVIVADNNSTDGSREILSALACQRLVIVNEPSFAYRQAETMNRLVDMADGASWIVPFDFDEWWYVPGRRIADALRALPGQVFQTAAQTYDMVPQDDDSPTLDPFARARWTRPDSLWSRPYTRKIAFRPAAGRRLIQGNHGLDGIAWPEVGPLRIKHIPYRSLGQATAKLRHGAAAVTAAALPPGSGSHWRELGTLSDADMAAWWREWTAPAGLVRWEP